MLLLLVVYYYYYLLCAAAAAAAAPAPAPAPTLAIAGAVLFLQLLLVLHVLLLQLLDPSYILAAHRVVCSRELYFLWLLDLVHSCCIYIYTCTVVSRKYAPSHI